MHAANARTRKPHSTRLHVELLEDRSVPAVIDMTTVGAIETIDSVTFLQSNPQPTGVGVINDFLRIQGKKSPVEQGYNSDARPVKFNEKKDHHTRAIRLSELPTMEVGGVMCRVILLGVNQSNSKPLISLDELRLYVGDTATLSGYNATTKQLGELDPAYDMGDNWVKLDASLTHGNGSGDMLLFVPDSLLASTTGNDDPYIYLYSKFGVHHGANGGFEQWAPGTGIVLPPDPLSSLSGFVYRDDNPNGVFDNLDAGLLGVLVSLIGTTSDGQDVSITIATNPDGSYSFTNLQPGTYRIVEVQPPELDQGTNNVGTINGMPVGEDEGNDTLGGITLGAGQHGINYNFGEVMPHE
jgi:hypothetical protein